MMAAGREPGEGASPSPPHGGRLAAGFVLVLMTVGCLLLWIGVPAAALWLAGKLTTSAGGHLVAGLALAIGGMLVTAVGLAWLNGLYLRITGGEVRWSRRVPIRRSGPLELLVLISMGLAIIAAVLWFFVLAENPTVNVY